jgi:hypothetical protein
MDAYYVIVAFGVGTIAAIWNPVLACVLYLVALAFYAGIEWNKADSEFRQTWTKFVQDHT